MASKDVSYDEIQRAATAPPPVNKRTLDGDSIGVISQSMSRTSLADAPTREDASLAAGSVRTNRTARTARTARTNDTKATRKSRRIATKGQLKDPADYDE